MKTSLFLSLLFVLFTSLSSNESADPPEKYSCKDNCEILMSIGLFDSMGDCISACNTCTNPGKGKGVKAACLCSMLDELGILETKDWTFGECVKNVKKEID